MASCQDRNEPQCCPVCLGHFKQPRKLPMCKHIFCETCISDTVGKLKTRDAESQNENESRLSCPLCRVVNRCPGNTDDLLNWIRTLEMAEQTEVEVKVENMGVCMPCKKLNNTTRAVKYCLDCRESLCTHCFEDTQRFRALQNHTVVEINGDDKDKFRKKNEWDMNQTLATYLACKHHPNKNVNFVCENHDELCCQACVILNHRQCDKVTELQQQILQMDPERKSTDLKDSLGNTVYKIIIQCQNVIQDIKDNETENKTAADKIDESLRNMRTKANRLFDVLEENISQESKAFLKKDSMSNDTTVQEIEEIISKLKLSSNLLENITKQGNRTLEYVVRRRILNLLSESETRLLETSLNAKMYGVELKPGSILSNFVDVDVNDTTKLATVKLVDSEVDLTEHTKRCSKITKTGTYHIQSEKSQVSYPTYSGLVYTPDNEVLLVDSENGMIRLASDTYKHLASCNSITFNTKRKDASKKPFSATFLDRDIVAASVPQKKTMLILKADQNLKIQTEIDMLHSAKAIVGLNYGDMAVSLVEPVAFGIVSIKFFHPEEKSYFNHDKSGRVLKSFDYMAIDHKKSYVIQPCSVDKAVFCFDFQGNPKFEYKHSELEQPAGVGVDASGNVYACDTAKACIHIISSNGYPISVYKEGCPERPLTLAFDKVGSTFAVTQRPNYPDSDKRKEVCVFRQSD